MYVAIQQQNLRTPIVFGIGVTAVAALDDARRYIDRPDQGAAMGDLAVYPCTPELAAAVERGVVACEVEHGVATVRR